MIDLQKILEAIEPKTTKDGLKFDETENEIRYRVREPSLFIDETFRSKTLEGIEGVRILVAQLKEPPEGQEGSMVLQAYRFAKPEWNVKSAARWIRKHPKAGE